VNKITKSEYSSTELGLSIHRPHVANCLSLLHFSVCRVLPPRRRASRQNFSEISQLFQDFGAARDVYLSPQQQPTQRLVEDTMKSSSIIDAPLSPRWAFVVQLREGTMFTPEAVYGRVEHLATGQATLFTSLDEVRTFMEQIVTKLEENPP
jgi:hypothetical protein